MNNLIINGDFRSGTFNVKVGNGAGTVPSANITSGNWNFTSDESDAATNEHIKVTNPILAAAVAAGKITQPDQNLVIGDSVFMVDTEGGNLGATRAGFAQVEQVIAAAPLALSDKAIEIVFYIYSAVSSTFGLVVDSTATYTGGTQDYPVIEEAIQLQAGWNRVRRFVQHPHVFETHPTLADYESSSTTVILNFDQGNFSNVNINTNQLFAVTGVYLGLADTSAGFDRIEEIVRTGIASVATASVANGVATGGSVGQVYKKNSSTNYDANFANLLGTGTESTTTGTIAIDLTPGKEIDKVVLTGAPTFNTTNRAAGLFKSIRIEANGADRALSFNASWKWLGTDNSAGVTLSNGKIAVLSLTCYGTAETDIVAVYVAQP